MMRGRLRRRPLLAFAIAAAVLAAAAELAARVVFHYKDQIKGQLPIPLVMLHTYQERDPRHPANWRLKPGFVVTVGDLARQRGQGVKGAAAHAGEAAAAVDPEAPFIRVNRDGFRGAEIDPAHRRPRVLALGDSTTFGTLEAHTYPHLLGEHLRTRGLDIEVINAGIEGYAAHNVIYRLDEYRALKPEITTIYLGWTALYSETLSFGSSQRGWLRADFIRLAGVGLNLGIQAVAGPRAQAVQASGPRKRPAADAPAVRRLNGFVPAFMPDIETIVREMRTAGSTVVLVTLPALFYSVDQPLSERAVAMGHLPSFTDNPYVLAGMTEGYNAALRSLARAEGIALIDLDRWSQSAFVPREDFFVDSVHVRENGTRLIGAFMAAELSRLLGSAAQ